MAATVTIDFIVMLAGAFVLAIAMTLALRTIGLI